MKTQAPRSIDGYLRQLREALAGEDLAPATGIFCFAFGFAILIIGVPFFLMFMGLTRVEVVARVACLKVKDRVGRDHGLGVLALAWSRGRIVVSIGIAGMLEADFRP